jgi:glucokinase
MKAYAFGVDIGGTSVKIGLGRTSGWLFETRKVGTPHHPSPEAFLVQIAEVIKQRIQARGFKMSDVLGVGVGVPGPVDENGVVHGCVNLGWGDVEVKAILEQHLKLPVQVGNDANVAALGEMWQGGGKGFSNLVMITLGTGIGGGVIINQHIVPGRFGSAGEIGHLHVESQESQPCNCGNFGCLEQYASATGIVRTAKTLLAGHPEMASVLKNAGSFDAKAVCDAARRGDALANTALGQSMEKLGQALAMISCVVDPDAYVIGGGVSAAADVFMPPLKQAYRHYAFPASKDTVFTRATLGNEAGIIGGIKLIMSKESKEK